MKLLCIAVLLAPTFSLALRAADLSVSGVARAPSHTPTRVWIRRATLVAGCAASLVFDTWTTRRAVSAGAIEGNGLLTNSQGNPQWGRMIGLKATLCGVSAAIEETHTFHAWKDPNADWTWTGINLATTAAYTWTAFDNLSLAHNLSAH